VEVLSRWLDDGLGPDGRRLIYAHMLRSRELMLRFNNQGVAAWEDRFLTLLWPVAARWAKRELGIGPSTIATEEPRVLAVFDEVAARLADGRPYLCGERFTAADLTFACLAAPVIVPPQYGVALPQPEELPEPTAGDLRRFRGHPAGAYALRLFGTERHRLVVETPKRRPPRGGDRRPVVRPGAEPDVRP
jgi:glutathione S-transferase